VTQGRFQEQRERHTKRARDRGVPEAVACLFAAVQQPRLDDEPSTAGFDAVADEEVTRLKARIDDYESSTGVLHGQGGIGGLLETEAGASARRLIARAVAEGLSRTAEALRSALQDCRTVRRPGQASGRQVPLPEPARVIDPQTGRPIGLWR
jgi:hypothetical protein